MVVPQSNIIEFKIKEVFDFFIQQQVWRIEQVSLKLLLRLLDMVVVDVNISKGVHEVPELEACYLRDHAGQQGVGRDVERDAQEQVGASLIKLAGQLPVDDIELEQRMARGKLHLPYLHRVPPGYDQAPAVRVGLDPLHHVGKLVDSFDLYGGDLLNYHVSPLSDFPHRKVYRAEVAPLLSVDGAQVAVLVRPFVPDPNPVLLQGLDVCVSRNKP